jgi:hypothetical protein
MLGIEGVNVMRITSGGRPRVRRRNVTVFHRDARFGFTDTVALASRAGARTGSVAARPPGTGAIEITSPATTDFKIFNKRSPY